MGRPKGSQNKSKKTSSTPLPQRSQTPLISIEDEFQSAQPPSIPPDTLPAPSQPSKKRPLPDFDRDGPPSSQELILQYFEEDPNNIKRFYGGLEGKSTIVRAGELSRYLVDNRGQYERTASSIHLKVNSWKRQWSEARDFLNQTGAGGGARKLADAKELGDEEYNKAQQEVEGDVLSKCPLWERLDPIFHEAEGGDPALQGDSAQNTDPTLNALEKALELSNTQSLNSPLAPSASVPPTPTPQSSSVRARSASRTLVKATSWNNLGDDSQSDVSTSTSSRRRQGSIERLIEKEQEYRDWKRVKAERDVVLQRELNETAKGEKIYDMAEITKRNNPTMPWEECIEQAERYIDRRIGRSRGDDTIL